MVQRINVPISVFRHVSDCRMLNKRFHGSELTIFVVLSDWLNRSICFDPFNEIQSDYLKRCKYHPNNAEPNDYHLALIVTISNHWLYNIANSCLICFEKLRSINYDIQANQVWLENAGKSVKKRNNILQITIHHTVPKTGPQSGGGNIIYNWTMTWPSVVLL